MPCSRKGGGAARGSWPAGGCCCLAGSCWRRPRPTLGLKDPQEAWKLRRARELLRDLPDDEAAVFSDKADLNLNPDIGFMWMERGRQAQVITPGNNENRYLAGSMSWRTGELVVTRGTRRNAELFVVHLEDMRHPFRRYRRIHVICDPPWADPLPHGQGQPTGPRVPGRAWRPDRSALPAGLQSPE